MSEHLPNTNQDEEVDLGVIINAIGNIFKKLFDLFKGISKTIFSIIIYFIKTIVVNFKLVSIVFLTSLIIGYVLEKVKEPVYYSEMLIKPYFESKYQLVTNINYFNSLIESKNYERLSSIFEISEDKVVLINKFEIEIGPETENTLLQEYDNYVKSIDSIRAQDVSYEDFVDNRDLYSSDVFIIRVESVERDIFRNLSSGIKKTFSNDYSRKLMRVRDSTIAIKKETFIKDLKKIDSLQLMYLQILKKESENGTYSVGLEGMFPLTQERTPTREYDLFQNEIRLRDSIRVLDQLKIEESVFYDVLSDFSEIGLKSDELKKKYTLIFPILSLIGLFLSFIITKVTRYAKAYE